MAEEESSREPASHLRPSECSGTAHLTHALDLMQLKSFVENDAYYELRNHFLRQGKGRPPKVLLVDRNTVSNGLLLQLFFLKEEANTSYRELTTWLQKLVPWTSAVSESQIYRRISSILDMCAKLPKDEVMNYLLDVRCFDDMDAFGYQALVDLGLNAQNITDPDGYSQDPHEYVSNEVLFMLLQIKEKEKFPPIFVRKWLIKLSTYCRDLSESKLRTLILNVIETRRKHIKDKKNDELDIYLRQDLVSKKDFFKSIPSQAEYMCKECSSIKALLGDKENALKSCVKDISKLKSKVEELISEVSVKEQVITELQEENKSMNSQMPLIAEVPLLQKKISALQSQLNHISDTKLHYKRNVHLKAANEALSLRIGEIPKLQKKASALQSSLDTLSETNHNLKGMNEVIIEQLRSEQECVSHLKKKLKSEQDMKSKYKKKAEVLAKENEVVLHTLNCEQEEHDLQLVRKENKSTLYTDNVRLLFMALQGEANVAAYQAPKVVMLVAKHLFQKNIPLKDLPCPRTCINFMAEANHIAKQHIARKMLACKHFTYASDGTGREKKHFMEHHIVLDDMSTLSVGFSQVANDKAETLFHKSVDILEELSEVFCQENGAARDEIFHCILSKLTSLMSDRAANMKLFNRKMLQYKKDMLGEDASVQFLYCNAHFLIGLATETEKAVKFKENVLEEESGVKLGRDSHAVFRNWSSEETSASRLIRTASDVFGPRGDEKNGCRQEWLGHCDLRGVKSKFTSYRSNRFNCIFENAQALLFHREESIHFIKDYVSHSNLKLQSICYDLEDRRVVSTITAIALLSAYFTTPYWNLMNSNIPYGKFIHHVQAMQSALGRWCLDDFDLKELSEEQPVFGKEFGVNAEVTDNFFKSEFCDQDLASVMFKDITKSFTKVLERQLADFLQGGIYGGVLPDELVNLLNACPLTNLTGERMFGDLDYDMTRRRTASTHLRSTINMWKHNKTAEFLDSQSASELCLIMASGRKHGKALKRKHDDMVRAVNEEVKAKIVDNEKQKQEKDIRDKEKQAALLGDILDQGGLCQTKEDLERLMRGPNKLQNLKAQIRFRKYYMGVRELFLTGNFRTLMTGLCNYLGVDFDELLKPTVNLQSALNNDDESDSA